MSSNHEKKYYNEDRPMSHEEAGRRGAEARWGREEESHGSRGGSSRSSNRGRYDEDDRDERSNRSRSSSRSSDYDDEDHHPMSREEAGRRGAEARWGREEESHSNRGGSSRSNRGHYDEDEENDRDERSSRSRNRSSNHDDNDDEGRPMSHEEAGRLGAEARWGGHRESENEYGGSSEKSRKSSRRQNH